MVYIFTYNRNNKGPKTVPRGSTLDITLTSLEATPFNIYVALSVFSG